jgi:hypothetical protein
MAGMGIRCISLAGLAPEVKESTIREVLSTYGDVKEVYEEKWAKGYPYQVYNGVRIAMTNLKKHTPSQLTIAGARALISYEGQPSACYGCNEQRTHKPRLSPAQANQSTKRRHKQTDMGQYCYPVSDAETRGNST